MFRFAASRCIYWPVVFPRRDDAESAAEPPKVRVLFHLYDREELNKRRRDSVVDIASRMTEVVAKGGGVAEVRGIEDQWAAAEKDQLEELVKRVKGWRAEDIEIENDDGTRTQLEFSEANLRLLLRDSAVFDAFSRGLQDASRGAFAKN